MTLTPPTYRPAAEVEQAVRGAAAAMRTAGAQVAAARPAALADPNPSLDTYRRWLGLTPEGAAGAEGAAVRREQASSLLWLLTKDTTTWTWRCGAANPDS